MPQPKKRNRLFVDMIDTVGLVDKGDDPKARIVFLKRAETFAEVDNQDKVRNEMWSVTDGISSALRGALFEADEDQDPEALILTSLDQFVAAVKTALPSWLAGQPYRKREGGGMADNDQKPDRKAVKKVFDAIGQAFGLDAGTVVLKVEADGGEGDDVTDEGVFKLEDLPEVAQAEFKKLQEKVVELTPADAVVKEIEPEIPEAVQKLLDASDARAKVAEERVEKLERETRRAGTLAKMVEFGKLPGMVPETFAPMWEKVEDALEAEELAAFTGILKGASAAVGGGPLLKVLGSDGGPESATVDAAVAEEVAKLQSTNPDLTEAQAKARVWKKRPDLYARFEADRVATVRTARSGQ